MKGQITKHEWRHVHKVHNSSLKKCKHCPVEMFKGLSTGKKEYFLNGVLQKGEPPCITRKIEADGDYQA